MHTCSVQLSRTQLPALQQPEAGTNVLVVEHAWLIYCRPIGTRSKLSPLICRRVAAVLLTLQVAIVFELLARHFFQAVGS